MTLKPSPQDWHSIGTGHANTRPIQVTIPRLLKGTSTIWSQTSLGMGQSSITLAIITPLKWRHNWRSNVNHTPIPGNANLWPILQSNANLIPICHFGWQSFTSRPPCPLSDQPEKHVSHKYLNHIFRMTLVTSALRQSRPIKHQSKLQSPTYLRELVLQATD